jgi:methyl-accepting chemotaxis protein
VVGGVVTVVAALVGGVVGWMLVTDATRTTAESVAMSRRVLDSVADSTAVVDSVFDDVADSLRDVQGTLVDASLTLTRAAVVTRGLGRVVSEQVPESIDAVRDSLPGLIDTANVVDRVMRGLSFFGVDYDPAVPLGDSIEEVDIRLAELPALLRAQQETLSSVAADLGSFSSATLEISDDLGAIRARLADAAVVIDGYGQIVSDSTDLLERLETQVVGRARVLRVVLIAVALGVAVTQTAPIALGLAVLRATGEGSSEKSQGPPG